MKYLKLYEAYFKKEDIDIQKVCDLYEDVKSIEYILEEKGIYPKYKLRVVCIPEGTLQKEIRLITVRSCEEIRGFLNRPKFNLREFVIEIENWVERDPRNRWSPVNKVCIETEFEEHLTKYFSLLKEHLDYIDESFIEIRGWRPPQTKDITISNEYFMK
jgi:hypothetical protein